MKKYANHLLILLTIISVTWLVLSSISEIRKTSSHISTDKIATNDVNLEAVKIKAGDTYIKSKNKVNITAVDSKYTESHFENSGFLSQSSTTE